MRTKENIQESYNISMHHIQLYIDNSRDIYCKIEWLANCVAKKMKQNKPVEVDHLANCSTIKAIIRDAAKMAEQYDGIKVINEAKRDARKKLAEYIINDFAPYLIEK